MQSSKLRVLALVILLLSTINLKAQLVNGPVTGFNNDVVANGSGTFPNPNSGVTYPTIGFDGAGYSLVAQGYTIGAATPTCYMPVSNTTNSL